MIGEKFPIADRRHSKRDEVPSRVYSFRLGESKRCSVGVLGYEGFVYEGSCDHRSTKTISVMLKADQVDYAHVE